MTWTIATRLAPVAWIVAFVVASDSADASPADLIERYADTNHMLLTGHFAGPTAGRIVSQKGLIRFAFAD